MHHNNEPAHNLSSSSIDAKHLQVLIASGQLIKAIEYILAENTNQTCDIYHSFILLSMELHDSKNALIAGQISWDQYSSIRIKVAYRLLLLIKNQNS